ncbi:MAG: gas vesicle protein K [Pseudomonadota bacterium]
MALPPPDASLSLSKADFDGILSAASQTLADGDGRLKIDPEAVERDLAKLVLVVVELVRRLMEHQALARMERGTLTDLQIDALSDALYRSQAKIQDLREAFGIAPEDFNLDLGPLGKVL